MRLERLEIAGFKSFPDRSELTFDTGVTAIVGPNGCGKSNVVDALTWVLGEQSAKSLRGDRMEDVIFGGSDARRPTAAAEVRLRLAGVTLRTAAAGRPKSPGGNGNGHLQAVDGGEPSGGVATAVLEEVEEPLVVKDVELMRRLYRSGESEYLIDGEVCRLRDVQDLLMDAGLGIKAYAVIEQGKIGQILSARPTDRRQLIEEAAGVTKYKSRRRAAELKLEAAQQNLTRVDDIIFEVEKQRGTLKRQAAKARRYRRLRDELRRWEKVQFTQRYRTLAASIETARGQLAEARERETGAAERVAAAEAAIESLRVELAGADAAASAAREAAHARELAIGRLQQQITYDRHQVETLGATAQEIVTEVTTLEHRREPARLELEGRREAAARAAADRDRAASDLAGEERTFNDLQTRIEGLEGDVEAARSEVFAAVNAATALRHAMDHAAAARARIGEQIAKLDVEAADLRVEADRAALDRAAAEEGLQRARDAVEALRAARAASEAELAEARASRDARVRDLREAEQQAAGLAGRLRSLEELDAARTEYGDGARLVLAEAGGDIGQLGSVADYLEADSRFERAVEACLGEVLQHVVVRTHDEAAAGLRFAAERNAGRVGFLVAGQAAPPPPEMPQIQGLTPMAAVVRVSGPAADAIGTVIGAAWVAESADVARDAAAAVHGPVATPDGQVFRGPLLEGGTRAESRGILATKREIKEIREGLDGQRAALEDLRTDIAGLEARVAAAESGIAAVQGDLHREEKAIVGFELQVRTAAGAEDRIARKQEQIGLERRKAEEELRAQEARQEEARESIGRIELEQRSADERLNAAQRRLFEAREETQAQARRTAEAKANHAALMERASALAADVGRLEEAGRELEARLAARTDELRRTEVRREQLGDSIAASEVRLEADVREFDELKGHGRALDEQCQSLRTAFDEREAGIKGARRTLEGIRAEVAQLDVARATAEADLTHLAAACAETTQATLDQVAAEVEALEREGLLASPRPVDDAPEPAEAEGEALTEPQAAIAVPAEDVDGPAAAPAPLMTADEMVADLRTKIDRMGPVNMMAIDQFDDLESRHTFLTAQRKDLIDSIAATGEAIRKIDKTTRERFSEAFTVINGNFERTFQTLFGGGRAGLVLLDETDALESGIDIIAQPPGKRLQSVQLLSGGEKALTAMALMFAIFQYRPSPFCLLDEIDAPLDDANIGRFVEMLQGMQDHTQFILITHNRKTMEIADRLYGVTMEEPGVSKLISVQLN